MSRHFRFSLSGGLEVKKIGLLIGVLVVAGALFYSTSQFHNPETASTDKGSIEITRDISDPVYPGSTFEVVLSVNATDEVSNLSIVEQSQSMTVISSPSGTLGDGPVSWNIGTVSEDFTLTYTAAVPVNNYEGFDISGQYTTAGSKGSVVGEQEVDVRS